MNELDKNKRLMKQAGFASVFVAIVLIVIKVFAWNKTSSVSIFASLIDSGMDALASIINLIAIRYALEPPDHDHRYGHGKAEAIAGLAQASFIAGSAVILLLNAGNRFLNPQPLVSLDMGMYVMLVSLALTITLVLFQRYVAHRTKSTAIKADAMHYLTDILSNAVTLLALYLATKGWPSLDIIIGVVIGLYILHSTVEIVRESMNMLLDRELSDEFKKKITDVVLSHSAVYGLHDMRTRQAGIFSYVQFHLELDDDLTIMEAHDISDEVEDLMLKNFENTETIIHIDPRSLYKRKPREGFDESWEKDTSHE
ncbi:MAG: cation diffusion facilitator family transporter [Lentisphaeraceae bacterium]|nr:cation diffusion facilitator family transporter [Lentisphaeraceae bacterium]